MTTLAHVPQLPAYILCPYKLKAARENAGITIPDAIRTSGIASWGMYEAVGDDGAQRGSDAYRHPSAEILNRIASTVGCAVDALLINDDTPAEDGGGIVQLARNRLNCDFIRERRAQLKLSMAAAGELAGMGKHPAQAWHSYESGRIGNPRRATLTRIAEVLSCTVGELLMGQDRATADELQAAYMQGWADCRASMLAGDPVQVGGPVGLLEAVRELASTVDAAASTVTQLEGGGK